MSDGREGYMHFRPGLDGLNPCYHQTGAIGMTRRELLAALAAVPLLKAAPEAPAAPVSISKCGSYDEDITAKLNLMFDQLGGIERLVRNKTVTIKVNMTGSPGTRLRGRAPALTHYTHPKLLGAAAYLMGRAGAKRIRFVESAWATAGPLEEVMTASGWDVACAPIRRRQCGVREYQRARQGKALFAPDCSRQRVSCIRPTI